MVFKVLVPKADSGNRDLENNLDVLFQMLCTGKTFLKALEFSI